MTSKPLQIRLLGPLEVLQARAPLDLPPSKKVRALLGYLVATGHPHGRSALCDLFWKDVADPRAGLRWALSMLRAVVDETADRRIVTSRDRVAFEKHRATVDLDHVRSVVSTPGTDVPVHVLEEAAAAFRGEFLEDLDLPGCHQYETWCLGMRERTRKLHLSIRRSLSERLRGEDADAALCHALVRLRLDPLSEEAYIVAIDILGDLGRVDPGLELYERCRRVLTEDLGTRPSPELIAARRRLRQPSVGSANGFTAATAIPAAESADEDPEEDARGTLSLALAALPAPEGAPEPGPDDPPLVGREAELEVVTRFARGAIAAEGPAVIHVAGEPGIGKTRLLRELVREVRSIGGWALSGPVTQRAVPPLVVVLQPVLLNQDLRLGQREEHLARHRSAATRKRNASMICCPQGASSARPGCSFTTDSRAKRVADALLKMVKLDIAALEEKRLMARDYRRAASAAVGAVQLRSKV